MALALEKNRFEDPQNVWQENSRHGVHMVNILQVKAH